MTDRKFSISARQHVERVRAELGESFVIASTSITGNPDTDIRYAREHYTIVSPEMGIARLTVSIELYNMKAMVGIEWPRTHDGEAVTTSTYVDEKTAAALGGWPVSIGLTITRNPGELARSIQNKLLGSVLNFSELVAAGLAEWKQRDRTNRDLYERCGVEYFGRAPNWSVEGRHSSYPLSIRGFVNEKHVIVDISPSGSMSVEVSFSDQKTAVAMLDAIKNQPTN